VGWQAREKVKAQKQTGLKNNSGKAEILAFFASDVSAKQRAEKELQKASGTGDKATGRPAAGFLHLEGTTRVFGWLQVRMSVPQNSRPGPKKNQAQRIKKTKSP